ncbi:uncharacterized protein LOC133898585 [Phragmites australis]|uniref:uncharacterized protein LOC133898585 n=1 Tax=Phragmites australis TaxID=29695 RepID=UPI002D772117|nr:uncharacterized protein LOC133898585 [Phragmites australis]
MASVSIKPLDGPGGYLRWKESLLLRAHTLGVARVLFEDRPTGGDEAAAKTWARNDAVCRGHILATLSDRLLPDYARFATAAELWRALARTYDVETPRVWRDKFKQFNFDEGTGEVLLEQLAHAEALAMAAKLPDDFVADELCGKLPEGVSTRVIMRSGPDNEMGMSLVWDAARAVVSTGVEPELLWETTAMAEDAEGCYSDDPKPEQNTVCWNCSKPGHIARNCGEPGRVTRKRWRRA